MITFYCCWFFFFVKIVIKWYAPDAEWTTMWTPSHSKFSPFFLHFAKLRCSADSPSPFPPVRARRVHGAAVPAVRTPAWTGAGRRAVLRCAAAAVRFTDPSATSSCRVYDFVRNALPHSNFPADMTAGIWQCTPRR